MALSRCNLTIKKMRETASNDTPFLSFVLELMDKDEKFLDTYICMKADEEPFWFVKEDLRMVSFMFEQAVYPGK